MQVLKIVMEDMPAGEVAAMYQDGGDAVVMVSRALPDDVRCRAVNDLLATVEASEPPRLRPPLLLCIA